MINLEPKKQERKNKKTIKVERKIWDINKKYNVIFIDSNDYEDFKSKSGLEIIGENVFELIEKVEKLEQELKDLKSKLGVR